jgi:type IV pilus assembly protein PilW
MAVFQVTGYNASNVTVGHNTGNANPSPGNSNKELGTPLGTVYNFGCSNGKDTFGDCATNPAHQWPASIAKMEASRWYIGFNDHGTRSLFHVSLTNSGGVAGTRTDEIAEGVRDMQLQYLLDGAVDYVDASALPAAAWTGAGITAVRIALTVDDDQKLGTDGNALKRELEHTVTLRNRTP